MRIAVAANKGAASAEMLRERQLRIKKNKSQGCVQGEPEGGMPPSIRIRVDEMERD